MYWVYPGIYLVFAKERTSKFCHDFKLFSIGYNCTDTPLKLSTFYFEAKSNKNMCRSWMLQLLIILYSYILEDTGIYSYILIHTVNTMYLESGWSRLAMTYCLCCTLVLCIAHSILPLWASLRSARWSGLPGWARHAQTAAATGWPRRHCCPTVCPLQQSMNPCACWTCDGLLESSYRPEAVGLEELCPPYSGHRPRRFVVESCKKDMFLWDILW